MRFGAALRILRPSLRQIEPVGDRQAHLMVGQRQRHRDLAIVRLAQPPAILARHAYRMRALFRKTCVVDDQRLNAPMRLERRRDEISDLTRHRLVRPSRLPDKMKQRLMRSRSARGRNHRRHRLNALALDRHQQACAVVLQGLSPIHMPEHASQFSINPTDELCFPSPRSPPEMRIAKDIRALFAANLQFEFVTQN